MLWIPYLYSSAAGLGDANGPGKNGTSFGGITTDDARTNTNNSLGLLFDTFVPISSILTIFIVVGFTLPRHEFFGLFWLVWWVLAVFVSLFSVNDEAIYDSTNPGGGGLFPSSSANDRISGVVVLVGLPFAMLVLLWIWWKKEASTSLSSRLRPIYRWGRWPRIVLPSIDPIQGFVLKHVPLWSMVAIHIYRLDGLSVLVPFWNGEVPNFVGYQTILLDVIMGITAIPLTYLLYVPRTPRAMPFRGVQGSRSRKGKRPRPLVLKDALWFWNSVGLYDLSSAYVVLVLNACGWGGPHITQPPLLPKLGRHPFPLLLLFQVPLAVAVHVLMLTHIEELMKEHEQQSQASKDNGLILPTTATTTNRR